MNLAVPQPKFIHSFRLSDTLRVALVQEHNSLSSEVFKDVSQCFHEYRYFRHVLKWFSEPNLQGCNLWAWPFALMTSPIDLKGL